MMYPPSMLLLAGVGGTAVPALVVSSEFVLTAGVGALLSSLGVVLSQADGGGGGGHGGEEQKPARHTDNSGNTRTYGRSVSDIKGQANRWAERMRRRGFDVNVPPVRYGRYGGPDVTVKATKGGQTYIRHFIVRG